MTLSYYDSASRTWLAGPPPDRAAADATMRRVSRSRVVELTEAPSSVHAAHYEDGEETLAQAQARRRAHQAEQAAGLDLSDAAVKQRADALQRELADWHSGDGARVDLEDAAEQATPKADALLAEMRELGLL